MASFEGLRGRINQHQIVALIVFAVVITLAIVLVSRAWSPPRPGRQIPTEEAFYDERTSQIVMQPAGQVPPITTEGGGQLVRAYLVPGTTEILYLEKYTDEAKAQVEAMMPGGMSLADRLEVLGTKHPGCMVRSPGAGAKWYPAETDEGRNLIYR